MGRSPKQKINKETQVLNDTLDESDLNCLNCLFRTFHPKEYIFFSSAHGTFSRIDHILGHKSNLSSVQVSRSVVSDSLRPPESQHTRPPCPLPTPGLHSDLNDTLDEMELIDIFRTFHPNAEEYTFFSSAHGIFSRINHVSCHKSNLSKFKKIVIISSIFSDHNTMS